MIHIEDINFKTGYVDENNLKEVGQILDNFGYSVTLKKQLNL